MEQVWPRAEVGAQISTPLIGSARRTLSVALRAVLLFSGSSLAFGHGSDFAVTSLEWLPSGKVRVEATVDWEGNLMLGDRASAEMAMRGLVEVAQSPEKWESWTDLGDWHLEDRSDWGEDAPVDLSRDTEGQSHRLLTAVWEWRVPAEGLRLRMAKLTVIDALLWEKVPGQAAEDRRWRILISGDDTGWMPHPDPAGWGFRWWVAGVVGLVLTAAGWRWIDKARRFG